MVRLVEGGAKSLWLMNEVIAGSVAAGKEVLAVCSVADKGGASRLCCSW